MFNMQKYDLNSIYIIILNNTYTINTWSVNHLSSSFLLYVLFVKYHKVVYIEECITHDFTIWIDETASAMAGGGGVGGGRRCMVLAYTITGTYRENMLLFKEKSSEKG